jgi:hypothetical protein
MQDDDKVKAKLKELNKGLKTSVWTEAKGFHAQVAIIIKSETNIEYDMSQAILLKNFVNSKTGEVKSFHWTSVRKD